LNHPRAAQVFVEMRYAFYAFCLATVTSMLCGQVLLALHRRVHDGAAARAGGAPAALAAHALKGRPPRAWQRCVAPAAVAVAALLGAGLTMECLTFDVGGAAGLLQDLAARGSDARDYDALGLALGPGQEKRAKFPTSKAPISAVFHSFRLIFGRAIISRNGLEAWMLFPERARAEHSC
jgi:hypothetical protein